MNVNIYAEPVKNLAVVTDASFKHIYLLDWTTMSARFIEKVPYESFHRGLHARIATGFIEILSGGPHRFRQFVIREENAVAKVESFDTASARIAKEMHEEAVEESWRVAERCPKTQDYGTNRDHPEPYTLQCWKLAGHAGWHQFVPKKTK